LEAKTVERLSFGIRSRRRARRQRLIRRAAFVSLAAMAVGVPGATAGIDLVQRLMGPAAIHASQGDVETSESAAGLLRFRNKMVESRPPSPIDEAATTETGEETVATAPVEGSIESLITSAATEFGLDPGYLISVATCESNLNPSAVNSVGYYGLFQFDQTTWASYGYGSIYDPAAQARTAARLISAGQTSRWPNCA
jgi:soluble lytic murein transglycosylase-like protein